MDASGWCTEDANESQVCKGADISDPTTVIMSGTILSYQDTGARQHLTDAAVEVIMGAIVDPAIGGYNDSVVDLPPEITDGPARTSDGTLLSTDPGAPTLIEPDGQSIVWMFDDDKASCTGPFTHIWQYRTDFTQPWTTQSADTYLWWVWTDDIGTVTGSGNFEFRVAVTDCANNNTYSETGYIQIDMPPEITDGPARTSDGTLLSTNPAAPTLIEPEGQSIVWTVDDDRVSCSDPATHIWQYRIDDTQEWTTQSAGSYLRWVWTDDIGTVTGSGNFEFRVAVTDCANNTTYSEIGYIQIDMPPEITDGPARTSDGTLLSTNPAAPTPIEPEGQSIVWTVADDGASCSGPASHIWQYRIDDTQGWTTQSAASYLRWVWTDGIGSITGSGTFQFQVAVTDCAGQTTESDVRYITISE